MRRPIIWHPYLFGLFPVLFLYAHNSDHIPSRVVILPLLVILLVVWLSLLLARAVLRDSRLAALLVSLLVLLSFSYGHVRALLVDTHPANALGTDKATVALCALVFALGAYALSRWRRNLAPATTMANWMALLLVIMSSFDAGVASWKARNALKTLQGVFDDTQQSASPIGGQRTPDIYYIVMDGYGREDVLRELYRHDNRGFLESLERQGFYVATGSRANYMQTVLSLASSLNLDYLDEVAARVGMDFTSRQPLQTILRSNRVMRFLKERGYEFVAFDAGYELTTVKGEVDYFLRPKNWLGQFAGALVNQTAARLIWEAWSSSDADEANTTYDAHRDRVLYTLDKLGAIAVGDAPKFVFAHVLAPHPPFVLGPNGEPVQPDRPFRIFDGNNFLRQDGATRDEYIEGYRNEVTFLNKKLQMAIEQILTRSDGNVIIILQGDHGPRLTLNWDYFDESNCAGCYGILNAYYLPAPEETWLYPEISPVNSFRVVLNRYFGTEYPLLPDYSYLSTWKRPYELLRVTTDREAAPGLRSVASTSGATGAAQLSQ